MGRIPVRAVRAICVVLGLASGAAMTMAAFAQTQVAGAARSDIDPDPEVLFGTLDNGLQYEIRRNTASTGHAALRMRVAVGSANERDDERGIAHFLEHMAFRGSTHLADGEAWKTVQRLGLQMGADANANTYLSQTVYKFDLPASDASAIGTGLMLLREVAGELKIESKAVDSERKVVQSEARLRDVPAARAGEAVLALVLPGQIASNRSPIGAPDVVEHVKAAELKRFYDSFYRPERTVIVAVGDFDPHQIEQQIKTSFADWHGKGSPGALANFGVPNDAGAAVTRVVSDPALDPEVTLFWTSPLAPGPETRERDTQDDITFVASMALNSSLATLTTAPNTIVRQAVVVGPFKLVHSASLFSLGVHYSGTDWLKALTLADNMRRRVTQAGLSQTDVDNAAARALTVFQQRADGAATQSPGAMADEMVRTLDEGEVYTSPAQDLVFVQGMLKGLTADTVNAALRAGFKGIGPRTLLISTQSVAGGEAAVAASVAALEADDSNPAVKPPTPAVAANWPYAEFGSPSEILERKHLDDLDTTLVRFANGVKLNVKPTKFSAGQISILASVGDGRLELPKDHKSAIWAAQDGAFIGGGLQAMDFQALGRAMVGKAVAIRFTLGDLGFELGGNTRPADFETELQVMAAYVKAPGFRPQPFTAARNATLSQINQLQSAPLGLFGASLLGLLHSNDPRWTLPTAGEIQAAQPDELRMLLANSLTYGPIEITVIGDVDVERVITGVGKTFGALGPRGSRTIAATPADAKFPAGSTKPVVIYHQGRADQGVAAIVWPTSDILSNPKQGLSLQLLCAIVQLRLTDQLRVAAGDSYTTQCVANNSITLPGFGFVAASADIQPEKADALFSSMQSILRDLRAKPVSQDEWDRVDRSEISKLKDAMQSNGFWIGILSRPQRDPRRLDYARTALSTLQSLTPADLQKAARAMKDEAAFRVVVKKEGSQ